tara:strand:+ start:241 stop:1332 length:1092 start_codon:yes stop_codon:yes gene_type:complete
MPRPYTSFTNFLSQGMQNTNQNINSMNRPDYGQNIMGQQGRGFYESPGGGEGEPGGSTGPGGVWTPGFGQETISPIKEGEYPTPPIIGNLGQAYNDLFNALPPYLQNQITQQGGQYGLSDPNSLVSNLISQFYNSSNGNIDMEGLGRWVTMNAPTNIQFTATPSDIDKEGIAETSPIKDSPTGYQDIPQYYGLSSKAPPTDPLPPGFNWEFINNEWVPVDTSGAQPIGGGGIVDDFFTEAGTEVTLPNLPGYQESVGGAMGGAGEMLDKTDPMTGGFDINNDGVVDYLDYAASGSYGGAGFVENMLQYLNPVQSQAQQFTGGGGTAGQQARRLYYPSTSGGFAGVGSGISQNPLDELLKNMGQ